MSKSWVEKNFLVFIRHRYPTGPDGYRLTVFGKDLLGLNDTRNPIAAMNTGFLLSCHSLIIARPATKKKIFGRFITIPLLGLFLGEREMVEVIVDRFECRIDGVDYCFEKFNRWEVFNRFPWLSIKGSKYDTYRVASEHEGVVNITFTYNEWHEHNIEPSPPMILEKARALEVLTKELTDNIRGIQEH